MDKNGHLLLLDLTRDEQKLCMEKDQLNTINELSEMLKSATRKPRWKFYITQKKSFAKIIGLKNTFELWDIWRLRNPNIKRFTFQQNHRTGFIQHRLDIFLFQMF